VNYLMNLRIFFLLNLIPVIYSDFTVQSSKCWQEIPLRPKKASAAVKAVFS